MYGRMRDRMPVRRVLLPTQEEAWLVARYEDVSRLLKDPTNALTITKDSRRPKPRVLEPLTRNMLGLDDPDHARLKKLVLRRLST